VTMGVDITDSVAASVMAGLKRECEANIQYNRLTADIVIAADRWKQWHITADHGDRVDRELFAAVRALQEWRKQQPCPSS
jgi:hypothetical protein